jgi:short-subunit dehydrogenase
MNEYFIIVGANGDIGFEILKSLNEENHNIIATYNNTKPNVNELKFPKSIQIEKLDLSSNNSIVDFIKRIKDQKITVKSIIIAAGKEHGGLISNTNMEDIKNIYEINVFGPFELIKGFSRIFKKNNKSSIVFISSITSKIPYIGSGIYGSSKLAFNYILKVYGKELSRRDVRINIVNPGLVKTKMLQKMDINSQEIFLESSNIKRASTTAELANLIYYLISDKSYYLQNQEIDFTAGMNFIKN